LINGQRGVVTTVDETNGSLRLHAGDHELSGPAGQLSTGVLDHAYALTVHQVQGLMVDRALLLGSTSLYREAGYVGLSRGRRDNQLFLTDQVDDFAYTDGDMDRPRTPVQHRPDAMTATTNSW
jgi:ATP-dependent exoDNAse (exonuclease V) alpha subunit